MNDVTIDENELVHLMITNQCGEVCFKRTSPTTWEKVAETAIYKGHPIGTIYRLVRSSNDNRIPKTSR